MERQGMDVDIACVGFGPAMGGFLHALSKAALKEDGSPALESRVSPGMPIQALCYERADDIGFGVSGIVTKARSIRKSFPGLDVSEIPLATDVKREVVTYLLDPHGASRRSVLLKAADRALMLLPSCKRNFAFELPYIPTFLNKEHGLLLSMGQFNQWVGAQLLSGGIVQIWPGMPVKEPLIEDKAVKGIRLVDQGVDKGGRPDAGFTPGMDIRARLTVVGDGPVGAVGQELNRAFGMPPGNHQRDWAVGMKAVVELPEGCELEPGTVIHTLGYPEPEIFGFLYVYRERIASLGVFVPSWFQNPLRSTYRYFQHWMTHPYLWRHLNGGVLRSWGAKSIQESGRRGEPYLCGDGYARIGEGSGTTNVLTNSGVDEAWESGVQLAEAVVELWTKGKDFSRENLEASFVARRRASWLESEGKAAEHARDGFQKGFVRGMIGTALAGLTGGKLALKGNIERPHDHIASLEKFFEGRLSPARVSELTKEAASSGRAPHDVFMDALGWPAITQDGKVLISHQDALLLGGKVQAPAGYADHVIFSSSASCTACRSRVCIEMCSGQAIHASEGEAVPAFDREKCVHCGACLWNCCAANQDDPERTNISFGAGAGGLHSAEN